MSRPVDLATQPLGHLATRRIVERARAHGCDQPGRGRPALTRPLGVHRPLAERALHLHTLAHDLAEPRAQLRRAGGARRQSGRGLLGVGLLALDERGELVEVVARRGEPPDGGVARRDRRVVPVRGSGDGGPQVAREIGRKVTARDRFGAHRFGDGGDRPSLSVLG